MMIKNITLVYLSLNLVVIFFCIITNNYLWLLNTQVAFISAMIIIIGSFIGYKKNIDNRVKNISKTSNLNLDDRDMVDTIDDHYDLYGEINTQEEFSKDDIKTILDEEKSKTKRNSFKNAFFCVTGLLSPYRIFAYIILIAGFFALNNNGLLHIYSYFTGLVAVSIATLLVSLKAK